MRSAPDPTEVAQPHLASGSVVRSSLVTPDAAAAYAAATNDLNPAYEQCGFAPPMFAVVVSWSALLASLTETLGGQPPTHVFHRAQDMRFYAPVRLDTEVLVHAETFTVRPLSGAAQVCTRLTGASLSAEPLFDTYCTTFVRGVVLNDEGGEDRPSHRLSAAEKSTPLADLIIHVDDDLPRRYSDASGDTMPIHLDEGIARAAGLPGIILQGLCTMAMCGSAIVEELGDGDPRRLRRLAACFSAPVLPGDDLRLALFDKSHAGGPPAIGFEALARGERVVKDGLAEIAG